MTVRRSLAIVVAVIVALALPYLIAGPNFHADDWVFVRNARFDGALGAAGSRQVGRLGAIVVYDLTFGAIGAHPLAIQIVQVLLWIAAGGAVLLALRRFLPARTALAVALVWLVVPTHSTLEHWASTAQALVALTFVAVGVIALADATDRDTRGWPAVIALAAAGACYEVTAAAALAALVAVPMLRQRRMRWDVVLRGAIVIALPLVWLFSHRTVYTVSRGALDPSLVLPGNLSLGLAPYGVGGRIVSSVALVGVLVAIARLVRPSLRPPSTDAEGLAVAGLLVLAIGVLPLAAFATNFIGMDDRLTVVSGIGGAMVWVGIVGMVVRDVGRPELVAIAFAALVVLAIPLRVGRTRDFVDAGDEAVQETHRLAALVADHPVVQVPGPIAIARRIDGLNDGWNATAATQGYTGRREVVALVVIDGLVTGPPANDPLAEFR
jgi:hypothetical protein